MFLGVLILVVISAVMLFLYVRSEIQLWGHVDRKELALFAIYDLLIIVTYAVYVSSL